MGILMKRTETEEEIIYQYRPVGFYVWFLGIFVLVIIAYLGRLYSTQLYTVLAIMTLLWVFVGALSTIPAWWAMQTKEFKLEGKWRFGLGAKTMKMRIKK